MEQLDTTEGTPGKQSAPEWKMDWKNKLNREFIKSCEPGHKNREARRKLGLRLDSKSPKPKQILRFDF